MSAEDELAAFQAEIAAVETAAVEDDDTGDGTPEELEFEDDDGTMYVWDRATRKYKPKGEDVMAPPAAAPPPTWSAADMSSRTKTTRSLPSTTRRRRSRR